MVTELFAQMQNPRSLSADSATRYRGEEKMKKYNESFDIMVPINCEVKKQDFIKFV